MGYSFAKLFNLRPLDYSFNSQLFVQRDFTATKHFVAAA